MSYLGNVLFVVEMQQRIFFIYGQIFQLVCEGCLQEVQFGCEFVFKMDLFFELLCLLFEYLGGVEGFFEFLDLGLFELVVFEGVVLLFEVVDELDFLVDDLLLFDDLLFFDDFLFFDDLLLFEVVVFVEDFGFLVGGFEMQVVSFDVVVVVVLFVDEGFFDLGDFELLLIDFGVLSGFVGGEGLECIDVLFEEGQVVFENGEYQMVIDVWLCVFFIDVDYVEVN